MDRNNHYETAFEGYLQEHGLCYVAVDETRRAWLGDVPLKSLDFIVHGANQARFLVDVKGRRFPGGSETRPRHVWKCWSERDDLISLERWAEVFGPGFRGLLVFMYHVLPTVELPAETPDVWFWRGRRYLLRAVEADAYRQHMKVCSPSWDTVTLPHAVFRELARPFRDFVAAEVAPF